MWGFLLVVAVLFGMNFVMFFEIVHGVKAGYLVGGDLQGAVILTGLTYAIVMGVVFLGGVYFSDEF